MELEEFSHKYYGSTPPHTFIDGKTPIDAGYKTPDADITSFCMLTFLDSTGDHMIWLLEVTTRSIIGQELLKIVRPPCRRLVGTQPRSVKTYNQIVERQFMLHRIPARMDAVSRQTVQDMWHSHSTLAKKHDD